ncbi:MAG TPA: hypothetical protein VMC85_23605 [Desulfomonilaceae bacterium]|nr:hypothetical protein [Desulfomonilaceae bacterium]
MIAKDVPDDLIANKTVIDSTTRCSIESGSWLLGIYNLWQMMADIKFLPAL